MAEKNDYKGTMNLPETDFPMRANLSARDVMKRCAGCLEPLMVPKHVAFVTELPKTASGKVDRKSLRERKDGVS